MELYRRKRPRPSRPCWWYLINSLTKPLARAFGFHLSRVSGSHHIFVHPSVRELLNLQDVRGRAKAYQVRQLLQLVERYNLSLGGEE